MRLSELYAPTLREAPRDLDPPGQQALARAGLFRLLDAVPGAGAALLPAGQIAVDRLAATLITAISAPVPQPIALPQPPGEATTADLVIALLARDLRSYRELPLLLSARTTAITAAPRARLGLLAAREEPALELWLAAARDGLEPALERITDALRRALRGLGAATDRVAAPAPSGHLGERWVARDLTDALAIAWCPACDVRSVASLAPVTPVPRPATDPGPWRAVATPDQRTVEEVAAYLGQTPADLLKTLIVEADGALVAALIPGDRDLSLDKLGALLGARTLRLAPDAAVVAATGAPVGFAGPVGLALPIVADRAAAPRTAWTTGGNARDVHHLDVSPGRDFVAMHMADIVAFEDRDPCPVCSAARSARAGLGLARIDRFGTAPADRVALTVDGASGGAEPVGLVRVRVRLARLLGAIAEAATTDRGLVWPARAAPWDVAVVGLGAAGDAVSAAAGTLAMALEARGLAILRDDRDLRPGQKLGDAETMGHPLIAVVGRRGLERGVFELRRRGRGDVVEIALDDAVERVLAERAQEVGA
ncbi:MAG: hypothetical protein CVU56_12200 [Deltaproteobacteria bacterium HGW-Deltaproteobacteria-14]|jgi:prolyl-tRNA synthetase|nr:MAG: hypothetical protein CVU56_12200 [Deltaproteobacteria bacterium HGW-Deltaproteobacteria-14]